jgi:hypothetical protein
MAIPAFIPLAMAGASVLTNAIRGVGQGRKARQFEADFEAKDKALQPVSAEQYSYLNRVRQMQRSMAMGTDPTSAMAQRGLSQSLAQTQGNIARLGTGASTVSGLLRAQQGYNMGMGQVAGQAFDQSRAYMQQEQGLIDNIQNSIYGLQMKRRNYAQIKAVGMRQDASDSATAAIAGLGQMGTMIPNKVGGGTTNAGKSFDPMAGQKASGLSSLDLPQGPFPQDGKFNPNSKTSYYGGGFSQDGLNMYKKPIQMSPFSGDLGTSLPTPGLLGEF